MMKNLFLLLYLCQLSSSEKHSLKYFVSATAELAHFSLVGMMVVDGVQAGYCDGSNKQLQPRQDWVRKMFDSNPKHLQWYTQQCFEIQPDLFKSWISSLKQRFNQSRGVHILQRMDGCEWDGNSGEVTGLSQYGYNGEDFLTFDMKTRMWISPNPQAVISKLKWNAERKRIEMNEHFLTKICPELQKMYLETAKTTLLRTVLPSVSVLQKTPSSPVSCHASGFYPQRAVLFWRNDEDEVNGSMYQREFLPNGDGTFQMRADLNVSALTPEDWKRYDCVFRLSGVEEEIITKLDKSMIRTNYEEKPSDILFITGGVVLGLIVVAAAAGSAVYRRRKVRDLKKFIS